jgi:hypothetical protein
MARGKIFLEFGDEVVFPIRPRVHYAFRIFAAIYDYQVAQSSQDAEFRCVYGTTNKNHSSGRILQIPARYRVRTELEGVPALGRVTYAGQNLCLVHGTDKKTGHPDWLGEIFEWLSSSLESPISARDSVGRIPYEGSVFSQQGISPLKPYATLLMAWMENILQNGSEIESLPKAVSPVSGIEHMVVCSHDLDFCFTNRSAALWRLSKNIGVAVTHYRSASYLLANSRMMLGLLREKKPGNYIPKMLSAIETGGFRSTLFAVADGKHRRDPGYRIAQIAPQLADAASRGFPIALHASYSSIVENALLNGEAAALNQALGRKPQGSRQHWLRFDRHERLFRAVEQAQLAYDSSLGFSESCGFRNGASFAFPPYDFENERPYNFLEIPLVMMDGSLAMTARATRQNPQALADTVLAESRKWGWGGVGILWHNPMEPIQVPEKVNRVFWECAAKRKKVGEEWMSAEQFLSAALGRFQSVGLLKEIPFDA